MIGFNIFWNSKKSNEFLEKYIDGLEKRIVELEKQVLANTTKTA